MKTLTFTTGVSDCHNMISTVITNTTLNIGKNRSTFRSFRNFDNGAFFGGNCKYTTLKFKYTLTGPRSAVGNVSTYACLTADPGVASLIPARYHTFEEIDHEIISTVNLLLPSADLFKKGCCQLQALSELTIPQ